MSFRRVREDCAGINKSIDSIESKLKDIEVAFLRAKVAELECEKSELEEAIESPGLPPFQPVANSGVQLRTAGAHCGDAG